MSQLIDPETRPALLEAIFTRLLDRSGLEAVLEEIVADWEAAVSVAEHSTTHALKHKNMVLVSVPNENRLTAMQLRLHQWLPLPPDETPVGDPKAHGHMYETNAALGGGGQCNMVLTPTTPTDPDGIAYEAYRLRKKDGTYVPSDIGVQYLRPEVAHLLRPGTRWMSLPGTIHCIEPIRDTHATTYSLFFDPGHLYEETTTYRPLDGSDDDIGQPEPLTPEDVQQHAADLLDVIRSKPYVPDWSEQLPYFAGKHPRIFEVLQRRRHPRTVVQPRSPSFVTLTANDVLYDLNEFLRAGQQYWLRLRGLDPDLDLTDRTKRFSPEKVKELLRLGDHELRGEFDIMEWASVQHAHRNMRAGRCSVMRKVRPDYGSTPWAFVTSMGRYATDYLLNEHDLKPSVSLTADDITAWRGQQQMIAAADRLGEAPHLGYAIESDHRRIRAATELNMSVVAAQDIKPGQRRSLGTVDGLVAAHGGRRLSLD